MNRPSPENPDDAPPPQDPAPPDSVIVALIIGPHGRDGGLNIRLLSDLPGRFDPGRELLLDGRPRPITRARQTGPDTALLWLDGITARRQAAPLTGKYLAAQPQPAPNLPDGEYFHYQLIGMRVTTDDGEDLGEIREILETGSNDVYIIRNETGELLIPATAQVIRQVDLAANAMQVRLPDGLR